MPQMALNLDFPLELAFDAVLNQLRLFEDFERADVPWGGMGGMKFIFRLNK
jgi:hypothetical protein